MRKVKSNPKSWQVLILGDKPKTGRNSTVVPRHYKRDAHGNYIGDTNNNLVYEEPDHELVDNFIFKAFFDVKGISRAQSSVLTSFVDEDDGHVYWATTAAMALIMRAVIDGELAVLDGRLRGFWTFRKMGTSTSIWPVRRTGLDEFVEYDNTELDNF